MFELEAFTEKLSKRSSRKRSRCGSTGDVAEAMSLSQQILRSLGEPSCRASMHIPVRSLMILNLLRGTGHVTVSA
jgi:hypothetical protein